MFIINIGGINLKKSSKIIYSILAVFGIFIIGASLYYVIANNENKNKNNESNESDRIWQL